MNHTVYSYNDNGVKKIYSIDNETKKIDGCVDMYDILGRLFVSYNKNQGINYGTGHRYYTNGKMRSARTYNCNGKLHGIYKKYSIHGHAYYICEYNNGVIVGNQYLYNYKNGSLEFIIFPNGKFKRY